MCGTRHVAVFLISVVIWIDGATAVHCPSGDVTSDCLVNFRDYAAVAGQWPEADLNDVSVIAYQWLATGTDPCVPGDLVYISGGEFQMGAHFAEGAAGELPVHTVYVSSFYMGRYEITNQQYCDFLNSAISSGAVEVNNGMVYSSLEGTAYCYTREYSYFSRIEYSNGVFTVTTEAEEDAAILPVTTTNWYGAAAYCNWRSQQQGYETLYDPCDPYWPCDFNSSGYRLPTEAEWEYAARGGHYGPYHRFPWGDTISHSQANYVSSDFYPYDVSPTRGCVPDYCGLRPVGSFPGTGYGLYDIAGNAAEWCNDWFSGAYYAESPYYNPAGPHKQHYDDGLYYRIIRGGSASGEAYICRAACRYASYSPHYSAPQLGFRVVLDPN